MIKLDDFIKEWKDEKHFRTKYRAFCDKCNADRGYLSKQNAQKPLCFKCTRTVSDITRQKMSDAKKGKSAWNKGLKGIKDSTREKQRLAKLNKAPWNKNKNISHETKIKLSCINRSIDVEEFDDFTTAESQRLRNKFTDLNLSFKAFERDGFRCQKCNIHKVELHAHHLNSWKHFPNERFELSNLVSLCIVCHRQFHSIYGNGKINPNTKEQFELFKISNVKERKKIIVVSGVSGSGKSWVCNQLPNMNYISYDAIEHRYAREILYNAPYKTIIYDPLCHVSTFCKRNTDLFDIDLIIIDESEDTIKSRLENRGGVFTKNIQRRIKRFHQIKKSAIFSGTSTEVLNFIKANYAKSPSPEFEALKLSSS